MVDTHTHIYLDDFDNDRDEVMQRAAGQHVNHLIFPNVDLTTIEPMKALHAKYAHCTSMAMGFHPTEVKADYCKALDIVADELDRGGYVAVGEVGIDLYWDTTFRKEQLDALRVQLQWAYERNLPAILHCREGLAEILEVVDSLGGRVPQCVFHSFTGTPDDVKAIRKRGDFYFGINGIVTFKKSQIPLLLPEVGLERLLLETDSPYLAPVPNRGRRNESANIPYICDFIASYLGLSAEEVSAATDRNANEVFKIFQ